MYIIMYICHHIYIMYINIIYIKIQSSSIKFIIPEVRQVIVKHCKQVQCDIGPTMETARSFVNQSTTEYPFFIETRS